MSSDPFQTLFRDATGHMPFPWQERLYQDLIAGRWPSDLDIPTGLGKTSVMAIWLRQRSLSARST